VPWHSSLPFSSWKNSKQTCTVHFEDLVGSKGSGDDVKQEKSIRKIGLYLGILLDEERMENIKRKTFGESHTFRRGQIGSWKEEFALSHREAFKALAGDLLIQMGYEEDSDW